jgi:hypothetical protein
MSRIISIFFCKLESPEDINLNTFIEKVAAFMEAVSFAHSSGECFFGNYPTHGQMVN